MAITSQDIDNQSFSVDRKGYSIEEVDLFLEKVSKEVGLLNDKIAELEKSGAGATVNPAVPNAEVDELKSTITRQISEINKLKAELAQKNDDGKAISEALIVAQRSAEKIVTEANDKSAKIIKDANDKADYIEKEADTQKKKVMAEIDKLEKEMLATRKDYQVMLRDIIAAMDKRLADSDSLTTKKSASATGKVKPITADTKNASVNNFANNKNNVNSDSSKIDIKPAEVKPEPEKDFSGFGDTDFGEDKID